MGYRSKFEQKFAENLKALGADWQYEADTLDYTISHVYNPDWTVTKRSGGVFYVETKGVLDAEARRKMLAVKVQNPDADIRFIFQKASNPIRKGSKTSYSAWCEKHGFMWAEKEMPPEWLE